MTASRALALLFGMASLLTSQGHGQQVTSTGCRTLGNQLNCTSTTQSTADPANSLLSFGASLMQARAAQYASDAPLRVEAAVRQADAAAKQYDEAKAIAQRNSELTAQRLESLKSAPGRDPIAARKVNQDLAIDWARIDGAVLRTSTELDNGVTREYVAKSAVVPTLEGTSVVHIRLEDKYHKGSQDLAADLTDVRIYQGTGAIVWTTERRPLQNGVLPSFESLLVFGDRAVIVSGGTVREATIPPGAIPVGLIPFVTAALPNPLPDLVQMWVFEPGRGEILPLSLRSQGRTTVFAPVATAVVCSEGKSAQMKQRDVVTVTMSLGTETKEVALLDGATHLLASSDVKCLAYPGNVLTGPTVPAVATSKKPFGGQ